MAQKSIIQILEGGNGRKKKRKPISRGLLRDLYIRAGGECEKCGSNLKGIRGHIHHKNRKPSDNSKSNLWLICNNCHAKIHRNDKPPRRPRSPRSPFDNIKLPKIY